MEAENYLSSGYGLRLAIEGRAVGWQKLGQMARVWQPSRLKGIQVGPETGTPFLAATQVFDLRPVPRKFLAIEKTGNSTDRFVNEGEILVTCSGNVGRATLANSCHKQTLISHDLLRVEPTLPHYWGWIYAYLRAPQVRAMMTGAQYGHIIKHLEIAHLNDLPVPVLTNENAERFQTKVARVLALRNQSYNLLLDAERLFADAIGKVKVAGVETGFRVSVNALNHGRRRFEASYHTPSALALIQRFAHLPNGSNKLSEVTDKIWWMKRFKRYYGEGGIRYLSADELFTTNPEESKKILVGPSDGHEHYYVKKGWILMACSGQVYGLNGASCIATEFHENVFFSHDLIRIIPKKSAIRSGYLLTTLTHPQIGRPALIRAAYGTSIPHLDPGDVSETIVPRLSPAEENAIADLAEASAEMRAEADLLDREIANEAGAFIDRFLGGNVNDFIVIMPEIAPQ